METSSKYEISEEPIETSPKYEMPKTEETTTKYENPIESTTKYDRCELRHDEDTKCSKSIPLRCDDKSGCQNNNLIEYVHVPNRSCNPHP